VPGIQGPKVMKALLEAIEGYGLYLHRVTQTQGIMRLTDAEISKMVELAHEYQTDLILAIGPRATTDTSASVHTEEGVRMGYRLRGQEQIVRAVEDVKRAARLGCRGFLVYDEGCLWLLNKMRADGEIIPLEPNVQLVAPDAEHVGCNGELTAYPDAALLFTVQP
jgi:hypothetical protein